MILRLVLTPAIALHADRRGDHRAVVIALSVLALAAILMVAVARGFWPILLVRRRLPDRLAIDHAAY